MGTNDAWMTRNPDTTRPDGSTPTPSTPSRSPPRPKKRHAASSQREGAPVAKRPRAAPRSEFRIAEQPGFVLHSYPYRETSLDRRRVFARLRPHRARREGREASAFRAARRAADVPAARPVVDGQGRSPHADRRRNGSAACCRSRASAAMRLLRQRTAGQVLRARRPASASRSTTTSLTLTRLAHDEPPRAGACVRSNACCCAKPATRWR